MGIEHVPFSFIEKVYEVAAKCPQHTFQILTKRPERALKFYNERLKLPNGNYVAFPNLWLGVSVEDQKTADERIPLLLQIPAAVRFISYEPALGAVDFTNIKNDPFLIDCLNGISKNYKGNNHSKMKSKLDWIIMGGESGHGARPMHPDWARKVRDDCQAAGVPFFFKQWGEWAECYGSCGYDSEIHGKYCEVHIDGDNNISDGLMWNIITGVPAVVMQKTGKKESGCLLDGKEHKEYPSTPLRVTDV
jgi:protein gp37